MAVHVPTLYWSTSKHLITRHTARHNHQHHQHIHQHHQHIHQCHQAQPPSTPGTATGGRQGPSGLQGFCTDVLPSTIWSQMCRF